MSFEQIDGPRVSEGASNAEALTWCEFCDGIGNSSDSADSMQKAPLLWVVVWKRVRRVGWSVGAAMADCDFAGTG